MAQDFSLRHPLIDGHGNFGSPDDPPAAARYTECRLAPLAMQMLAGIDEDTVDFVDNYTGEFQEPVGAAGRFPNLLVNGSQGIAVGMATNIPPHNLGEVIDATVHLIDHPDATPDDLMQFVKGPDFPTGALIMGRAGHPRRLPHRPRLDPHAGPGRDRGGHAAATSIVVTELPVPGVAPSAIQTKITELVNSREIEGIARRQRRVGGRRHDARHRAQARRQRQRRRSTTSTSTRRCRRASASTWWRSVDGVPRTLNLAQTPRPPTSTTRSRSSPAAREYRLDKAPGPRPTSSRACSRPST